jgi:hypothetical protein
MLEANGRDASLRRGIPASLGRAGHGQGHGFAHGGGCAGDKVVDCVSGSVSTAYAVDRRGSCCTVARRAGKPNEKFRG